MTPEHKLILKLVAAFKRSLKQLAELLDIIEKEEYDK